MSARPGFDWGGLMRAGVCGLGLRPAEVWALTPGELLLMLGGEAAGARPLPRARLDALMARYPDARPGARTGTRAGPDKGEGE